MEKSPMAKKRSKEQLSIQAQVSGMIFFQNTGKLSIFSLTSTLALHPTITHHTTQPLLLRDLGKTWVFYFFIPHPQSTVFSCVCGGPHDLLRSLSLAECPVLHASIWHSTYHVGIGSRFISLPMRIISDYLLHSLSEKITLINSSMNEIWYQKIGLQHCIFSSSNLMFWGW